MLHSIDAKKFGPLGEPMAHAVQACVHCGFCLAACPTYTALGEETDSPRGRIVLMKQVLEGTLPAAAAQPHLDRCLGCLACEPACPSGVPYRDLISPFRAVVAADGPRTAGQKWRRWIAARTIPYPWRFRLALAGGKVGRLLNRLRLVPKALQPMLTLVPKRVPAAAALPRVARAQGERRARVALLAGCAQQVLEPDINLATIDVLTRNGVEVVVPRAQGCCGGLAWHTGDLKAAQAAARKNLKAFPDDVDAVLTNAAGCGSALHEYATILRGTPDEARAQAFQRRVLDVSVFLHRLGLRETPRGWGLPRPVLYHDACHLANAQGVREEPRALLRAIPGVTVLELPDGYLCCGSAGTYNLDQPELAARLGRGRAIAVDRALAGSDAAAAATAVLATGNIGCLTQLKVYVAKGPRPVPVRHTMQVLRDAYTEGSGK